MGPVDDGFVGVREAGAGGEDGAGVADADAVAEEACGLAEGGGEVEGAGDQHAGWSGVGVDEDRQLGGAGVAVSADVDPGGASRSQEGAGLCYDRPLPVLAAQGAVVRAAVAEEGEGAAEEFRGVVGDLGYGGGSAPDCGIQGAGQVGLGCWFDALDQDVDLGRWGWVRRLWLSGCRPGERGGRRVGSARGVRRGCAAVGVVLAGREVYCPMLDEAQRAVPRSPTIARSPPKTS